MREANGVVFDHALCLWFSQRRRYPISTLLLCEKAMELNVRDSYGVVRTTIRMQSYSTTAAQEDQRPCSEKMKVYNGTAINKRLFSKNKASGFICCMNRIRFSDIQRIVNPNDVRSQLIRINHVLLYCLIDLIYD
ncbi:hypothetical protein TNCV_2484311 [Trichonephila clavipes]|uniref:Uncharacterized protein n=1 Tax=Trichonephila clavipes TaxID=2585209 RepID=A0A8X6VZQ1_TRICX|nr:hypothetical protein TNCV_2484311 [Trichonephila clavipes]